MIVNFLTMEDLALDNGTVFVRADINTPVDPQTGKLLDLNRIREASITIRDLASSRTVIGSHQGRVGREDYISMQQHSEALSQFLGKNVNFVEDVFGPSARDAIRSLKPGDVLLLDNLRFAAEENLEYSREEAAKTFLVERLRKYFDACVLDAFPTAHRGHPSIIGFPTVLPACAGRLVVKELKAMSKLDSVAKGPYTTVLGGSKISDRLEAIDALIENRKADKVLLTGEIASMFLRAAGKIKNQLGVDHEERYVAKAKNLLELYKGVFELPVDVAVEKGADRHEIEVSEVDQHHKIMDIGSKTIMSYSKIIRSSGTVFMSGPPGVFERPEFKKGTDDLLTAMASSLGTTVVSGGHLYAAVEKLGIKDWMEHVSTSGGALILFLSGRKLPMIEALEEAAARFRK